MGTYVFTYILGVINDKEGGEKIMWSKVLKFATKYGAKAIVWLKNNWRWLVQLAIDIILDLLADKFG